MKKCVSILSLVLLASATTIFADNNNAIECYMLHQQTFVASSSTDITNVTVTVIPNSLGPGPDLTISFTAPDGSNIVEASIPTECKENFSDNTINLSWDQNDFGTINNGQLSFTPNVNLPAVRALLAMQYDQSSQTTNKREVGYGYASFSDTLS